MLFDTQTRMEEQEKCERYYGNASSGIAMAQGEAFTQVGSFDCGPGFPAFRRVVLRFRNPSAVFRR